MWIFVRLFRRYRVDFLFLVLCIIGFVMLYQTKSFQGMMINNFLINISGAVNSKSSIVTDYFGLKEKNTNLENRIVELQNNTHVVSKGENFSLASVSYIDINKKDNYLIIDKGYQDGISTKSLVVTPQNTIVGKVVHTTKINSLVQTVMSSNFNVTAQLKDGTLGLTYWDFQKFGHLKMKNIPSYVKMKKGDEVRTSGKGIFPGEILIGTVDNINVDDATKFFIIDIKLATNFYMLDNVEVMEQQDRAYRDTLLNIRDSLTNESTEL